MFGLEECYISDQQNYYMAIIVEKQKVDGVSFMPHSAQYASWEKTVNGESSGDMGFNSKNSKYRKLSNLFEAV